MDIRFIRQQFIEEELDDDILSYRFFAFCLVSSAAAVEA